MEYKLKLFNFDFIFVVGDIDVFLKVRKLGLRLLLYDIVVSLKSYYGKV